MAGLGKAMYAVGFWIRETGQALDPESHPDHPFHETHGDVEPAGEPDPARHVVRPARVPVLP
uniref:Uncharacterized protein n=1 Tax=Zea mays TaxID=4577 RepID=B6T473_MAIZE|nr:hypothetical protein [Zea mays]